MSEQIRENISNLSDYGSILPLIQGLQINSFNYKRIVAESAIQEHYDDVTGVKVSAQPEKYVPYPQGIQVMIDPSSLESMYPEAVVTSADGNKHYRSELLTAFLVQAVKELSIKIQALESK